MCGSAVDVLDAIASLKSNSVGHDSIPLRFLKMLLPFVLPFVVYIFNSVFTTSVFPEVWKISKIIPIPKGGGSCDLSDLKPISILSSLSKAFEKLVKAQIGEYISNRELLFGFQSGFRPGHSTSTALLKITDDVTRAMDRKLCSILVLLDFSKAFDTVSHKLLLSYIVCSIFRLVLFALLTVIFLIVCNMYFLVVIAPILFL